MKGINSQHLHKHRCCNLVTVWQVNHSFSDVWIYAKQQGWRYTRGELLIMLHSGCKIISDLTGKEVIRPPIL